MSHKSASSTAVAPPGAHHIVRSYSNLLPARPFKRSVASRLCLLRRVRARLALSGHTEARVRLSAFGAKRTSRERREQIGLGRPRRSAGKLGMQFGD